MKKVLLVLFLGFYFLNASAQLKREGGGVVVGGNNNSMTNQSSDSNKSVKIKLSAKTNYTDFKIISSDNDTTIVDTTLTLKKDFRFNYLRKDNFGLLPFHNQGQTFNRLHYNFENNSLFPLMGMDAKQYNYYSVEDVKYYYVPTPTTELMYRTGLEQGQVLDAFLTMNTSKQFNFSLAYKGLRSLGKYRESLSSHGNFRTTFNYHSKNKVYYAKGHFASYDLFNNENGGLPEISIGYFESNDPNYIDRGRLDVNLSDTENMLEGKRYYLDQSLILFSKKNKLKKGYIKKVNIIKQFKLDSINAAILLAKYNDSIIASDSINSQIAEKKFTSIKKDSIDTKSIKKDSISISKQNDSIIVSDSIISKITQKEIASIKKPRVKKDTVNIKSIKKDSIIAPKLVSDSIPIASIKKGPILGPKKKKGPPIDKSIEKNTSKDSVKVTISTLDSIKGIKDNFELKIGHKFMYETKHYRFKNSSGSAIFGDTYDSNVTDHTAYQQMDNQLYLEVNTPFIGTLRAKANYYKYNYHYNSILYLDSFTISDKLKGNALSAGADWKATIGKLAIKADATSIVSGDLAGNSLKASISYKKDSVYSLKGYGEITSKSPNFNKILFQSGFKDYNWQNNFDNEEIKTAGVEFALNKWGSIKASYNLIDNFTYFDTISRPQQAKETLNYVKVKANQYFTFRNFTLDNTVMYQNVLEGESFFRVPQIITRNTLYYSNYVFKGKPLYLQTGVTFKYFTAFKSNAYNPLLSEFVLQNDTEIGNFPILDFFFNMQVQRTRIFFKVENFGASFTGRNYYAAPNYPYRDLTVRFGLVWNFFI